MERPLSSGVQHASRCSDCAGDDSQPVAECTSLWNSQELGRQQRPVDRK
jgi:hypothetical protein